MRFVVQSKKATLINLLVILFSLSFYMFILLLILYTIEAKTFFPKDIILDIKGNPEEFLEPKPFLSILEQIHISLFLYITSMLVVSSILYRTLVSNCLKGFLITAGFLSVLFEEFSILGVVYISDIFAYIKFISFLVFAITLSVINTINFISFLTGKIK